MKKKIADNSIIRMKKGLALFIGSVLDTDYHKHHALQLTLSVEKSFSLFINGEEYQSRLVLINSNVGHRIVSKEGIQALLLIEPETVYGKIVKEKMCNRQMVLEDDTNLSRILSECILSKQLSINGLIDAMFYFWDVRMIPQTMDARIEKIICLIEQSAEKKISIKELAAHISISESRLQHIFKNQLGISIKRYLLWKRMIDGINTVVQGNDLTFASHESGFSDSSHMSRTFKEMFGINLSDIFINSRSLQVIAED